MTQPNWDYELKYWTRGRLVAGMDEVGRGALAGPVVVACVALAPKSNMPRIDDSKRLTAKQREAAAAWIKMNAMYWSIGVGSVDKINNSGIVSATNYAHRKAIESCDLGIDSLLLDAFYIPYLRGFPRVKQNPIIKGDQKSISIAAASIVAKVYRDNLMRELSNNGKYSPYFWDKNKGYGTATHRSAIAQHGITKLHRKMFVRRINYPVY